MNAELDPLLLHPLRLYLLCALAGEDWQMFGAVADRLDVTAPTLSSQATTLRFTGYLESRREGRRTLMRLTPLGRDRLSDHVAALETVVGAAARLSGGTTAPVEPTTVAVEVDGGTRYVRPAEVQFVEANRDFVRLHTPDGAYLARVPIYVLAERWERDGFARVHRGFVVALDAIRELRQDTDHGVVARTALGDVPVSQRHIRELRERLAPLRRQR